VTVDADGKPHICGAFPRSGRYAHNQHPRQQQPRPPLLTDLGLKGDWPHLTQLTDAAALDAELGRIRAEYNTIRLHAAIGYVPPDDEHHGRGPEIRRARAAGIRRARAERIKQNRANKK